MLHCAFDMILYYCYGSTCQTYQYDCKHTQKNVVGAMKSYLYLFLGFTHVTNSLATVTISHVGVPQA